MVHLSSWDHWVSGLSMTAPEGLPDMKFPGADTWVTEQVGDTGKLPFTPTVQILLPVTPILEHQEDTGRNSVLTSARCFLVHAGDDFERVYSHVTEQEIRSLWEPGLKIPSRREWHQFKRFSDVYTAVLLLDTRRWELGRITLGSAMSPSSVWPARQPRKGNSVFKLKVQINNTEESRNAPADGLIRLLSPPFLFALFSSPFLDTVGWNPRLEQTGKASQKPGGFTQ